MYGMIMLQVSQEDKEALKDLIMKGGFAAEPNVKISVYKNRRGQYKDILLWCKARKGICRIEPLFITNYQMELLDVTDLKINVTSKIQASAF